MSIELLFENRKLIGENILNIIKDNGYTKSSFSRITDISRPTLNELIKGEVNSLATFKTHIQKILESQNMNEEQLLNYVPKSKTKKELIFALSDNAPENHALNPNAQEMFGILEDIVHMCELYYN
ncbi:helix-turn-helix domain-containing protein [Petroclostridium xylanilyticum]|uniref:helix-turn-helix domain-containing protein n=1 Tax=Petroclostridium xylanilyticum TaxID=1792311 RepID=UPI000B9912F0|nr:helix-turn-helix transcriptional regulator [Petroclostridium xylanilyticum]